MDQILVETIRLTILIIAPILVICSLAGILTSFLQKLIRVEEATLIFSVKCLGIGLVMMTVMPPFFENLQALVILCTKQL